MAQYTHHETKEPSNAALEEVVTSLYNSKDKLFRDANVNAIRSEVLLLHPTWEVPLSRMNHLVKEMEMRRCSESFENSSDDSTVSSSGDSINMWSFEQGEGEGQMSSPGLGIQRREESGELLPYQKYFLNDDSSRSLNLMWASTYGAPKSDLDLSQRKVRWSTEPGEEEPGKCVSTTSVDTHKSSDGIKKTIFRSKVNKVQWEIEERDVLGDSQFVKGTTTNFDDKKVEDREKIFHCADDEELLYVELDGRDKTKEDNCICLIM